MHKSNPTDDRELTLLLLFKDELSTSGQEGIALVTESMTIARHIEAARRMELSAEPEPIQLIMNGCAAENAEHVSSISHPKVKPVPTGCFVWGWWRKPWETHHKLLPVLKEICDRGDKPTVFLYSQYLRRIYQAILHDLYFVPETTTVELPIDWVSRCPIYYADTNHLNGAFFVMEIPSTKYLDPNEVFSSYYIDASSFDIEEMEMYAVIRPPDGVIDTCRDIIDKPPTPVRIRISEHTMFALRKFQQKALTLSLIKGNRASDAELEEAFAKMEWNDVRDLIRDFGLNEWRRLYHSPRTIETISSIARRRTKENIIRFDLFLIASIARNSNLLTSLFLDTQPPTGTELIQTLARWATESEIGEQRQLASSIFIQIWKSIQGRYDLADLSEYFKKLPEFEEIAHSTRYGIQGKFYRDHLNHNVRAALLSGYLADQLWSGEASNSNRVLISFLAGLFHDIALPISSFESTAKILQGALGGMGITTEFPIAGSLIDRTRLKECLGIVALYASLPRLHELHGRDNLNLESHRDEFLKIADPRLLYEEMLCSMTDEHSLLSAAVLLYAAALGKSKRELGVGIRKIGVEGFGHGRKASGTELIQLIQAVALHDRKAAAQFPDAKEEPIGVPVGLAWEDFPIPTLLSIADDLQEWGRPIAKFDQPVISDARINVSSELVEVEYALRVDPSVLGATPYSFLEHLFGKIRSLKRISNSLNGSNLTVKITMNIINGSLTLAHVGGEGYKLELKQEAKKVIWPRKTDQPLYISPGPNGDLYAIESIAGLPSGQMSIRRDFILLIGDDKDRKQFRTQIGKGSPILSFSTDGTEAVLTLTSVKLSMELDTYIFSALDQYHTISTDMVDFTSDVGIIRGKLKSVTSTTEHSKNVQLRANKGIHLQPTPHFMDLDWRFSWEAAQRILRFVTYYANKKGRVCYLGCPTLAIFHTLNSAEMGKKWTLIDKGHYAIEKWIENGIIDKDRITTCDLRRPLPNDLLNIFDVVIMDPPWYEDYYTIFWRRALELVKRNGLIGVCEYAGYDIDKSQQFLAIRKTILRMTAQPGYFASIGISYAPPPFETFWAKDAEFTDAATQAYRPTFIDFYRIATPSNKVVGGRTIPPLDLSTIIPLEDGHYLRCRDDLDWSVLSTQEVRFRTRKNIDVYKKDDMRILAWSTNNTLVENVVSKSGIKVSNEQDLREAVISWEKKTSDKAK